jgi:hypothetical protein
MSAQPRIVTRREWGAATTVPGNRGVSPGSRRYFVVHWPVMGPRDERQWCRDIERMHSNQGWAAAPGYNYLVGMSGAIFEGCGRDVRGIHSPPHNTDGWGCCVLQPSTGAGVPTAPISPAAKAAVRTLYDWLGSVAGRPLSQWWHGRDYATACPGPDLREWVAGGMQVPGGATSPPTPTPTPTTEEVDMLTSAVADNGTLHVFGATAGGVFYTFQPQGKTGWNGGQAGKRVATLQAFAPAPSGKKISGLSACKASNGALHLFAEMTDGTVFYTWQPKGSSAWNGGAPGKGVAALTAFAPKP